MTGILAFGAYIPRLRLQRSAVVAAHAWYNPGLKGLGKGERSFASWDEDAITMAVEAARDCLGSRPRQALTSVMVASTSFPFVERTNATIIKEALNLSDDVSTVDFGGSTRTGVSGLIQALRVARTGEEVLCIGSDKCLARPASEAELVNGDAAAAFLVGEGPDELARILAHHSVSADFVDRFRMEGRRFDYEWETRWVRDEGTRKIIPHAVEAVLAKAQLTGKDIDAFIFPSTIKGTGAMIAHVCGVRPEAVCDGLEATVGVAGAAHSLLMLAQALENSAAGQKILIVGFGSGCDVVLLEKLVPVSAAKPRLGVSGWLARRTPEQNYMKFLAFNDLVDLEKGMRAEFDQKQPLTALWRHRKTVLGLVAGRSETTGKVQYPRSDISVHADAPPTERQVDYPLANVPARILSSTADNLTFTIDPPAYYGMIEFEGGGRMYVEFCDVDSASLDPGTAMRMVFRIKAVDSQRGFKRYFWKAAPERSETRNG